MAAAASRPKAAERKRGGCGAHSVLPSLNRRLPTVESPITQWLVGLPASWFLAFPRALGEQGLWGGIIVGAAVQAVVLLAMLARWDWNKEAERVRTRMAKSGGSSGEAGGEGLAFAH